MASFLSRFFGWLFGKKKSPKFIVAPGMNIAAPQTLVARVAGVGEADERRMIKLAEESLQRGFPEQAAVAYRKAARRFHTEGQHLKRISVLNQLARVNPNDPRPFLELVEANELLDRKRDADLARMAAAAAMRNAGQHEEAEQLEAAVRRRGPPGRAQSVVSTHHNEPDSVDEMPGDAVPMLAGPNNEQPLPPVMPSDLAAPASEMPALTPSALNAIEEGAAITMSKIDASGPLELPLEAYDPSVELGQVDPVDQLEAMDASAVFDSPAAPLAAPTDPMSTPSRDFAIDPSLLLDDETEEEEDEDRFLDPMAQTIAVSSIPVDDLALPDDLDLPTHDPHAMTMAGVSLDDEDDEATFDPNLDVGAQTIAMEAIDMSRHHEEAFDIGAETMAYEAVDSGDIGTETRAYEAIDAGDVGAMTIGMGMPAVNVDDVGLRTMGVAELIEDELKDDDDDVLDPGAQTIAVAPIPRTPTLPPIANTRELPKDVRFNIGDAATQMEGGRLPSAIMGTEHEKSAIEDSQDQTVDPEILEALRSKIGG